MRLLILAAILPLTLHPLAARAGDLPPKARTLAEATCKATEDCESFDLQPFPSGKAAFLWLESGILCGSLGCNTQILVEDAGGWRVVDPPLITQPLSATWVGENRLTLGGAGIGCALIWHWTGQALEETGEYLHENGCVVQ